MSIFIRKSILPDTITPIIVQDGNSFPSPVVRGIMIPSDGKARFSYTYNETHSLPL